MKVDVAKNDPLLPFFEYVASTNPQQYTVPEYISNKSRYVAPKKTNKYPRDVCELCGQKGVQLKCCYPGCNVAYHLNCYDPPLFTIPPVFYCDLHQLKKKVCDK